VLTAVTLLIMGILATLLPRGSSPAAAAAGEAQETLESSSPPPSETPAQSETPVETFNPSARSITIESADDDPINYRDLGEVRGIIRSDNPTCVNGQVVRIAQRPAESSDFTEIGTDVSGSTGRYEFVFTALENADYIASVDQSASCAAAEAGPVEILVRVQVFLGASDLRVSSGERVTFRGIVRPCGDHATTRLELRSRRRGGDVPKSTSRKLDKRCEATFTRAVRETTMFTAVWPQQDNDHAGGKSERIVVKVIV
jgi:hypothetical protein